MLYVDSPAGVGLSLADFPADLVTNDTHTAADSEEFLRAFFDRYPLLQERDFYISGEARAAHACLSRVACTRARTHGGGGGRRTVEAVHGGVW